MLCYAMLCYAMLCYAMLCYAMLCYAMLLCYVVLCYVVLCYVMLLLFRRSPQLISLSLCNIYAEDTVASSLVTLLLQDACKLFEFAHCLHGRCCI